MSATPHDQNEQQDSSDQLKGGLGVLGLLRRLLPYFSGEWLRMVGILSLVAIHAFMGRGIVMLFGYTIDHGILAKNQSIIMMAAAIYLALELAQLGTLVAINSWFARVGNRVLHRLREHLVRHVQSLPASYFDRVASGKIVTRLTSDPVSLTELFQQGLLSVISNVVTMLTITVAMLAISPRMTFFTLLVAPPMSYAAFLLSEKILRAQREAKRKVSLINAYVAESVTGMRVIQLFDQAEPQRQKFENLSAEYRQDMLRSVRLYALFYPSVGLFTAVTVGVALWIGGELTGAGAITTGAMVAFILHVKDFGDPLRNILERYQIFQNSVSSGERLFALIEESAETAPENTEHLPRPLRGELRFEHVSFRYRDELPLALDNVSFTVPAGKTLAVIGRTGSGKSTLISLLQRFRDPCGGQIFLDDIDLSRIPREEVRRVVGVVQQDVFLFRGSLAENIGLGDPQVTRERIEWAAHEAGLSRLIEMRPGGLETHVEEKGANLSLGERQLVAFARILAFDPEILVLDEATANVDSETELVLQAAARRARQGRTAIVIAHRLSTLADADLALALSHGRMALWGSPDVVLPQAHAHVPTSTSKSSDAPVR